MYRGRIVGVVVPAYNEEGLVGEVIDTVPSFVDRVYAIDDRSTDGTWEEIQRHARRTNRTWSTGGVDGEEEPIFDRRVVPIRQGTNTGVGGAIKTGYRQALSDGVEVIAVMNGDGQMDPDILDRIIDPIVKSEADYVKGNRLLYADYREGMSPWRLFGNSVLSLLTKISSGYWKVTDPQNGYTAISREALSILDLESLYEDYGFCNDMLVQLNVHDMRIADVAMPAVYGDEQSTIRYSRFIPRLSVLLFRRFLQRLGRKHVLYDFHPLVLFYLLGTTGILAGICGLLYTSFTLITASSPVVTAVGGVAALVVAFLGSMSFSLAMLLDMHESDGLESLYYDRITKDDRHAPETMGIVSGPELIRREDAE